MGSAPGAREKRGPSGVARTADRPGQTANVDLCFVPATHEAAQTLPGVSGSSGRLVLTHRPPAASPPAWPGQVFEDAAGDYATAMQAFVGTSAGAAAPASPEVEGSPKQALAPQETARTVRSEERVLREQRRVVRARRTKEDAAWRILRTQQHVAPAAGPGADAPSTPPGVGRSLRTQRHAVQEQRQAEDALWRQQRQSLRARLTALPVVTAWIAVLVLTDNCTRRCLGVPLFVAGAKVTAAAVTTALRALLPPELQFLISDRGVHFTAHDLAALAQDQHFVHVLIARHRPQSNGIAERFVRTLKEWLAPQAWQSAAELTLLLAQFRAEYNDRPHQGLALPGLSPTEFERRIWLL